jgi:peptide/nickel transport system permease protein
MNSELIKYTIRRTVWVIPVLLLSTMMIFSLVHIMPGSPAEVLLPRALAGSEEYVKVIEEQYNLDQPIHMQYLSWVWGLLHGDMGTSFLKGTPVAELVWQGTKRSILLGILAAVIGTIIAIPAGVVAAVNKDSWTDHITRFGAISGISLPEFWLALMVILIFSQIWNMQFGAPLIPPQGYVPISEDVVGWAHHTIGPALVLAVPYAAVVSRITRASMVDVLNEEYITTARSKGVKERAITWSHALKNAMIPVVTVAAYSAGIIFNGSVLVETVFSYPGLGWYVYSAALDQDFPLLMGTTIVIVMIYIFLNYVADIMYAWLDPRISYGTGAER